MGDRDLSALVPRNPPLLLSPFPFPPLLPQKADDDTFVYLDRVYGFLTARHAEHERRRGSVAGTLLALLRRWGVAAGLAEGGQQAGPQLYWGKMAQNATLPRVLEVALRFPFFRTCLFGEKSVFWPIFGPNILGLK